MDQQHNSRTASPKNILFNKKSFVSGELWITSEKLESS